MAVTLVLGWGLGSACQSEAQETESAGQQPSRGTLIVVVSPGGEPEFEERFRDWAESWHKAGEQGELQTHLIGVGDSNTNDLDVLKETLAAAQSEENLPLWLVLLGHGTFDGRDTKFILRGPDLTIPQLTDMLASQQRPLAIIGAHSASGELIKELAGPNRVIVTATKSPSEVNFSHFGGFLVKALSTPTSDLDKDHQVSLLEGFLVASRMTQEFYEADGRLATEHALIDDNGDGTPVRAEDFRGIQPIDPEIADGARAHQWHVVPSDSERQLPAEVVQKRDALEIKLAELRRQKGSLGEEEYYRALEVILVDLARLMQGVPTLPANVP
ncbi:MAG: hypothetical protein KDA88_15480 [Planctomycetaceae bacterium]|nr:hypothetical protein [Planctomycetaceae bacterium]